MGPSGRLEQKCLKEEDVGNLIAPMGMSKQEKSRPGEEEKERKGAEREGKATAGSGGFPFPDSSFLRPCLQHSAMRLDKTQLCLAFGFCSSAPKKVSIKLGHSTVGILPC